MPRFLVPQRLHAHRIACFALYRSVLNGTARVPLSPDSLILLRNLIRDRFRQNRQLTSYEIITYALRAGYEGNDLLRSSAAGNAKSTARIENALSNIHPLRRAALSRSNSRYISPLTERPKEGKQQAGGHQFGASSIFARPRLHISGPRHVPKLINGNQVPFLRIKKPQPHNLSRIIDHKIKMRNTMFERLHNQEDLVDLAADEDLWDQILRQEHGVRSEMELGVSGQEPSWKRAIEEQVEWLSSWLNKDEMKRLDIAKRMQVIADLEQELADKEGVALKAIPRRERLYVGVKSNP